MAVSLMEHLSSILAKYLLQEASLVSHFREDFQTLNKELESIKSVLEITGVKRNSPSICNWLGELEDVLDDAVDIVEEFRAARNFRYNLILLDKMSRKIKKLNERITKIHLSAKYIKHVRSVVDLSDILESTSVERLNASARLLKKESPPVGMENDIEKITDLILKEEGPRVIAVVGVGGQGKTLLVQSVSKSQRVQKCFQEHRSWVVVSQKWDAKNVFKQIGSQLKLGDDNTEEQIKNFIDKLQGKRCLFVFDDVWDTENAQLIEFIKWLVQRKHNIVITSRKRKVAESFRPDAYIHTMSYLSDEHSWELFCIYAFPDCPEHRLPEELKNVNCHPILEKCHGLPLAIKTTGAYMSRVRWLPNEWERTTSRLNGLDAMKDVVMASLRLSYEALRDDLKPCFLFFSVFPKKFEIECQHLLNMWIAQGFVSTQVAVAEIAYDVGRSYINELIDRCLIEVSQIGGDGRVESCKIHDLLHDMAVSESLKQTKCLFKAGEQMKTLPVEDCNMGLRSISLMKNDISTINEAIDCSRLRILLLSQNFLLASISERFFKNLTYLTVLDLSHTDIRSLPKSIGKLKHLKYLNLSWTNISELPENLTRLRRLQFLDVCHCSNLSKLHSGIGKHESMLYLNVESCGDLKSLPVGISELGHLQTLKANLWDDTQALQLSGLKGLTSLQQLSLEIGVPSQDSIQVGVGTFGEMKKMRTLSFKNNSSRPLNLPSDMGVMARLEVIRLQKCVVPEWIFWLENLMELKLDFIDMKDYKGLERTPNLKRLHLSVNDECIEFPKEFGEGMAFPRLEELVIAKFSRLEKFPSLHPEAMPMLKYFRLRWCDGLKKMVEGIEKLKSLEEVEFLIKDDTPRAEDLWNGKWLHILKARQIKITVTDWDQSALDSIVTIVTRDIAIDSEMAVQSVLHGFIEMWVKRMRGWGSSAFQRWV